MTFIFGHALRIIADNHFLLLCLLTSATAFAQFSGKGTGDYNSPYQITTAAQLDELRNCLKEETYVKLMNDIDLTDYIAKNYPKEGWEPINSIPIKDNWRLNRDNSSYVYFDGNHKTISGLSIKLEEIDYVGLFGTFVGEMKNLTVECDIDCSNCQYTGGLCGYADYGQFYNCQVKGTITGSGTGGLCGFASAQFESCSLALNSKVSGSFCGGICGESWGGQFFKCRNQGTVSGDEVGGIVGWGNGTLIDECSSSGVIDGGLDNVGGIMGLTQQSLIRNCTTSGTIVVS